MNRRSVIVFITLLLLTTAVLYGTVFSGVAADDNQTQISKLSNVMEVIALVRTRHYQPVSAFDMIAAYARTGTINGMLAEALDDPYTRFMDPYAFEQMMTRTTGVFGGIGIVVGMQDEVLTIVSPIKGTPGERAGLRGADQIVAIDGRDTTYMTIDEAVSLMRGQEGTDITLTIQRDGERFDVHIVRDIINVESVTEAKMLDDQIGYIQMTNFSDRTYEELTAALDKLEGEGMQALIFDLRFNPGGTLAAAIEVANEFISEGPIVYLQDRQGRRQPFEAVGTGTRDPKPMVVLINGGSASASEIVAGALRDTGLATLVGTKTFGKGLVQSVHQLRDGSALTLTEQSYLTAGGHDINKVGIPPDEVIEISEEEEEAIYLGEEGVTDKQLERALQILHEKLAQ